MSCDSNATSNAASSFPDSSTMETLATNLPIVWQEISMIQQDILAASSQCQPGGGQMCTTIGGNTPMTFVTGVTSVTIVNGGAGYYQDTPSVKFIPPIGVIPSIIATGTVTTNGGNIFSINITNGGAGYQPVDATMSVSSISGINAVLQPLVDSNGAILNINIANAGTGYTINDTVTATRAVLPNIAYVNAVFKITAVSPIGAIIEIVILNPGSGYQPSTAQVQIVSSLNNALPYPLGTGFMSTILTNTSGTIIQVVVDNTGAGYAVDSPFLVISNPGSGAQTAVTLGTGLSATSVAAISVIKPGSNYVLPIIGTVFNPPAAALPNPPSTPAVVAINISANTFNTNPNLYWNVWAGTTTNKSIQLQLNQVISYFTNLGYTVQIQSNPATGSTLQWIICW